MKPLGVISGVETHFGYQIFIRNKLRFSHIKKVIRNILTNTDENAESNFPLSTFFSVLLATVYTIRMFLSDITKEKFLT